MPDFTHESWREHARNGYNATAATASADLRSEIINAVAEGAKAGSTVGDIADTVMCVVQPRLDAMVGLMERYPDVHMNFSLVGQDEPMGCADWCYACQLDNATKRANDAEATIARVHTFAKKLRDYCSPHGVSATYASQLEEVLNGENT